MNVDRSPLPEGVVQFQPTHWTLVLAAAESRAPGASSALARLCQLYWYPLYAFVRRRGKTPEDAQDLTQGFFLQLLEHRILAAADQRKGKFRSFLLAAFQHYLSDQADRARCLKRGGHGEFISLDFENAENRYAREPADAALTAEQLFDARWAILLLGRAKTLLRQKYAAQDRTAIFEALKGFLESGAGTPSYEAAAAALGLGLGTTKTLIHRLRRRYTTILRQEIARTVSDPSEVDAEVHALCEALIASEGRLEP